MEDLNNTNSDIGTNDTRVLRPSLIIQALAFTGILYFSVGQTPSTTRGAIFQSIQSNPALSAAVSTSVLQHAARDLGLPTSALRIVEVQSQTWSDRCLGLTESGVACTPMLVSGWQIAVASGQQRWFYRTNTSGSVIKREGSIPSVRQASKLMLN